MDMDIIIIVLAAFLLLLNLVQFSQLKKSRKAMKNMTKSFNLAAKKVNNQNKLFNKLLDILANEEEFED